MRAYVACLVFSVASCLGSSVGAQSAGQWGVVRVVSSDAVPAADISNKLRAALRAAGQRVLDNEATELAARSYLVTTLEPEKIEKLRALILEMINHLGLHEVMRAVATMHAISTAFPNPVLAGLHRADPLLAQEFFGACVMLAYGMDSTSMTREAQQQALECASRFPGFTLTSDFQSPVGKYYADTLGKARRPTTWVVKAAGVSRPSSCVVRINGVSAGSAPVNADVWPAGSTTYAALECEGVSKRAYRLDAVSRNTVRELSLDPTLDNAVTSTDHGLLLRESGDQHRADVHAVELGALLDLHDVLLVLPSAQGFELRWVDVNKQRTVGSVTWNGSSDAQVEIKALLVHPVELHPQPTAASSPSETRAAPAARDTEDDMVHAAIDPDIGIRRSDLALYIALDGLFAAAGVAAGTAALLERSRMRGDPTQPDYDGWGQTGLGLNAVMDGAVILLTVPLLPEADSIPWWAWAAGGVGVAIAGGGIALWAGAAEHCDQADKRIGCKQLSADPLTGPLLLINAAAPLSLPITYLIASALHTKPSKVPAIRVGSTGAQLSWQGRF